MRSWLEALPSHPVLARQPAAPVPEADTTRRTSLLAMRGTDMIVVVENELRITPLAQTKRVADQRTDTPPSYKVLHSDMLDFPIQCVHVNPTGKLLAVVGTHTLALVILPRRGYMNQVGLRVPVRVVRIGAFYHAPHGTPAIAQCRWHPLGTEGASLVVLTEDAIVREYDVVRDVDEPQQTIAVLPSSRPAPSKWSAADEDEQCAVSFACVRDGASLADSRDTGPVSWLPYTLFVLMRSGDIFALCPFLPRYATLSRAAVHALAAHEAQEPTRPLALRYLTDLLRQMPTHTSTSAPMSPAPDLTLDDATPLEAVPVVAPSSVPHRVAAQGPCLLRPSPRELDDEYASQACDLWVGHLAADDATAHLDVLALAARDGSVHLGLVATPIGPEWVRSNSNPPAPTIAVHECIDLALPAPHASLLSTNFVVLLDDSLYPDTLYVAHQWGVHVLSLQPWTAPLLSAMVQKDAQALTQAARTAAPSHVARLVHMPPDHPAGIAGALVLHDAYLSYTFIVLTADGQLAGTELALQRGDRASTAPPREEAARPYHPVLTQPWEAPRALHAAQLTLPPGAPRAPVLPATPEALRSLGQLAEAVRGRVQDVGAAGSAVQARVSEQMAEMQRQLRTLHHAHERATALSPDRLKERIRGIEATQGTIMRRLDTLLQQLMDEHMPQLSVYERRWFDELARLVQEFGAPDGHAEAHRQKVCMMHSRSLCTSWM